MLRLTLWLPCLSALLTLAGAVESPGEVPIVDERRWVAIPDDHRDREGRRQGHLPAGLHEDSAWAQAWVSYERLLDADYDSDGMPFLRISARRVVDGRVQLRLNLPPLTGESFVQVRCRARGHGDGAPALTIRRRGGDYRSFWRRDLNPHARWNDHAWDMRLSGDEGEVCLIISLERAGVLDLAAVSVKIRTRAELLEALAASGGGVGNLMPTTRFPLGLPEGWTMDRQLCDRADLRISSDTQRSGPSGAPSLRLEAVGQRKPESGGASIYSAPIPLPASFLAHTASMSVYGDGTLTVNVFGGGVGDRILATTTMTSSAERGWQRVSLTFTPRLLSAWHALGITVSGTLWIDAVKVEAADAATPWQAGCEVHLALPDSDASVAGVQFDDEPALVQWAVCDAPPGTSLQLRVVHADGGEVDLPPLAVEGPQAAGTAQIVLPPGRRFGPVRIEARLRDASGVERARPVDRLLTRLPRPRFWGVDAPDSPFGIHTLPTRRHLVLAKALGLNWVRLHDAGLDLTGWAWVEPEPGRFVFDDARVDRYREQHLLLVGELGTAPKWASRWRHTERGANNRWGYHDWFMQPESAAAYQAYVERVVAHFRGRIDTWSVWNEPYWASAWSIDHQPQHPAARSGYVTSLRPDADFAALTRAAVAGVRTLDPPPRLIGGCTRHGAARPDVGPWWTARLEALGAHEDLDVLEYHHYAGEELLYPGDVLERGFVQTYRPILDANGRPPKPIWMTEGNGARAQTRNGMHRYALVEGESEAVIEAADRQARYAIGLLSLGVEKVFLYSMHGHRRLSEPLPNGWPALVGTDGRIHPSGAAQSVVAWMIDGTRYQTRGMVAPDVHGYRFAAADRQVLVVAGRRGHGGWQIPALPGVEAFDVWGNLLPPGAQLGTTQVYLVAAEATALDAVLVQPVTVDIPPWPAEDLVPTGPLGIPGPSLAAPEAAAGPGE